MRVFGGKIGLKNDDKMPENRVENMKGKNKKLMTFFGAVLPHWRSEKIGGGSATVTFVFRGRLVSKKNNQMAVVRKKEARDYLFSLQKRGGKYTAEEVENAFRVMKTAFVGNKEYGECQRKFLPELEKQKKVWEQRLGHKGLKFPLKKAAMTVRFYFKDKYITDTVNKQQTVQDLLIEAGIIANDDYKTLNPIHAESGLYKDQITENLAVVRLAFQLPKNSKKTLNDELK